MTVKITILSQGPSMVESTDPVVVTDDQGNVIDTGGKTKVALCRCGYSANRPFCDGSHKTKYDFAKGGPL